MGPMALMFAAQAGGNLLQGLMQRKDMQEANEQIAWQNIQQIKQARESIASVQMQQAFARQQSAQTMSTARRVAMQESGAQTAQAAAAGVRGASVDAVQNDIQRELGEAIDVARADAVMTEFNLNQQIRQIARSTILGQGQYHDIPSLGQTLVRSLVGAGISSGSQYAAARFKFGASPAQ